MKLKKSTNQTKNYPTKEQIKPLLLGLGIVFSLSACQTKPNVDVTKKEPISTPKPPITREDSIPVAGGISPPPTSEPKVENK